jgi:superfamily II DNA or RNA helicase
LLTGHTTTAAAHEVKRAPLQRESVRCAQATSRFAQQRLSFAPGNPTRMERRLQPSSRPPMRLVYDNGTVLLAGAPPALDAASLPGVLWDPRVRSFRAPAFRHRSLRQAIADRGQAFDDEVMRGFDAPIRWQPPELRPYQEAALAAWELADRRGFVALPTGSGKTRVAIAAMARIGRPSLCLVPTRVLLDQWHGEIARSYAGSVGRLGDGAHDLQPITVATFESAYRHMSRLGNRFDLLVVDEAHHFGCGVRDEILEMSAAPARLGLSATPPRDPAVLERLAELIGPVVFELAIGDLSGRYLAPFDAITLHVDLSPDERRRYDSWMATMARAYRAFRRGAPSARWEDFCRAAGRTADGREALHAHRRARELVAFAAAKRAALGSLLARHRDRKVLVFTADNAAAYAIARESLVMPLTCDIGRKEREAALERFRGGQLRALVSARVLNEGIDVPDADVAIIVGAALGEREHVQRVGRLLRPRDGKRALVYEIVVRGTLEVRQAARRRAGLSPRNPALV